MPAQLRSHDVRLVDGPLVLRPMTESDWDVLLEWNTDAEVLYFSEGDNVTARSLEVVHRIYRGVSRIAFVFVAELEGRPIGECWLQEMNLEHVLARYDSSLDLRRIDLTIGEKAHTIAIRAAIFVLV